MCIGHLGSLLKPVLIVFWHHIWATWAFVFLGYWLAELRHLGFECKTRRKDFGINLELKENSLCFAGKLFFTNTRNCFSAVVMCSWYSQDNKQLN